MLFSTIPKIKCSCKPGNSGDGRTCEDKRDQSPDKCKNMSFLIGIIEQSGRQLWIFKINILFINDEFERGTTSESTCKSFNPVYYNRNNPYPNGLMLLLNGQENCRKIAKLSRHRIQRGSPFAVYTLVLDLHWFQI